MKDLKVNTIEKSPSGHGHYKIIITVTGVMVDDCGKQKNVEDFELNAVTNNMMATDAYFDSLYDEDLDNEDSFYECRMEAAESLVGEVLRNNKIYSDFEITTVPTLEEVQELRENLKEEA